MNFILTNEHRKYMGLKPIDSKYELVKLKKGQDEECYLYFNNDKIVKVIKYTNNQFGISMHESDVNYDTKNNKTIVLPKTNRGKERKLTVGVIDTFDGEGNYLYFYHQNDRKYSKVIIGNYTTQRTFYKNNYIENCKDFNEFKKWCDLFVEESTDQDLQEVQNFCNSKRQHVKFKKDDYFRVKLGRNQYTYGRILLDVYKETKKGKLTYWNILMGRPVIIEIFHILTDRKDVKIEELKQLKTFPSQHILDNKLYYGDFEIIGNDEIPENVIYPIMYGKSISYGEENMVHFQCGEVYRKLPYNSISIHGDYKNNGIGFNLNVDEKIIKKCLEAKSNDPYWQEYEYMSKYDLRSPMNKEKLRKLLLEFNLDELIKLYCP